MRTRLQQGFTTGGMGSDHHFAWQQSARLNVRFGSIADMAIMLPDVRFIPKADMSERVGMWHHIAAKL